MTKWDNYCDKNATRRRKQTTLPSRKVNPATPSYTSSYTLDPRPPSPSQPSPAIPSLCLEMHNATFLVSHDVRRGLAYEVPNQIACKAWLQ